MNILFFLDFFQNNYINKTIKTIKNEDFSNYNNNQKYLLRNCKTFSIDQNINNFFYEDRIKINIIYHYLKITNKNWIDSLKNFIIDFNLKRQ